MRAPFVRCLTALTLAGGVVAGCYHDKYQMKPPEREDYALPPHEKRFNEPETAPHRPPLPPKEEKTLLGRPPTPTMPVGVGGFGP
jgi:hypothetical protein